MVDHYELSNAMDEAKRYADEKARESEFYTDDKIRDLKSEIDYLKRRVEGLKGRIESLEYRREG